ncbi:MULTISPECIES: DUF3173 family protein [Limosilactobacillus]|uniref:DUF3173 family protein n=1 Tax=Limosilactobacillus TaxID=2742598 RepID=UPI002432C4AF|nr:MULTISPECIES: DUF3173 family protein [Limosilactobacillus]MCI6852200.1 DUF3173 domain-containing protein [Limosilactobacillus vaginalis]MDY4864371.1 DUF3173 family protein [Limosilactobacillus sp.]
MENQSTKKDFATDQSNAKSLSTNLLNCQHPYYDTSGLSMKCKGDRSTVDKEELMSLGFRRNQAKTILHDARQVMVKRGKNFWANPRLEVAPRVIVEKVILGFPLRGESNGHN